MSISRRNALKIGAACVAAAAVGTGAMAAEEKVAVKKLPVGLQLYSVRQAAQKDLAGVLRQVAEMGFAGVEFAGYYGHKADAVRKMLDENKIVCCGTHTPFNTLQGAALPATLELNKTLGNPYVIVPSIPEAQLATAEKCKETAKVLDEIAVAAKAMGMRVGYHAHGGDFKKVEGGKTRWETLFENCGPEIIAQLDTCNCAEGGADPVAMLKALPGRAVTVHLKEYGGKHGAVLGEGEGKWDEIFKICESTGGTAWYIIEHESDPKTPMESVKRCLESFRKMGK